jgi:hypothetical protein
MWMQYLPHGGMDAVGAEQQVAVLIRQPAVGAEQQVAVVIRQPVGRAFVDKPGVTFVEISSHPSRWCPVRML